MNDENKPVITTEMQAIMLLVSNTGRIEVDVGAGKVYFVHEKSPGLGTELVPDEVAQHILHAHNGVPEMSRLDIHRRRD
jgi:hypothetical protein